MKKTFTVFMDLRKFSLLIVSFDVIIEAKNRESFPNIMTNPIKPQNFSLT